MTQTRSCHLGALSFIQSDSTVDDFQDIVNCIPSEMYDFASKLESLRGLWQAVSLEPVCHCSSCLSRSNNFVKGCRSGSLTLVGMYNPSNPINRPSRRWRWPDPRRKKWKLYCERHSSVITHLD